MSKDEIATKQDIADLEDRLKILLVEQFNLLIQEMRLHHLQELITDERFSKKQVCKLLNKSPNTIDKLTREGKLIAENWGDGKKRSLRYPKSQFFKIINTSTQAA